MKIHTLKKSGFTLIELVVVIVLLSILAITAAPKFLGSQSDARAAALKGLKASMESAVGIVYGKAVLNNLENIGIIDGIPQKIDGIDIEYGYPVASETGIGLAVNGLGDDWVMLGSHAEAVVNEVIVYSFANTGHPATCVLIYKTNEQSKPTINTPESDLC